MLRCVLDFQKLFFGSFHYSYHIEAVYMYMYVIVLYVL